MNRLAGKTALVTGATGGIGEATARQFLNEGANVMLVGRSAERLEATASRLGSEQNIARHVAEATDEAATAAAVAATLESFGGLDIVFANAGIEGAAKPIELQTFGRVRDRHQHECGGRVAHNETRCVSDEAAWRWLDHCGLIDVGFD